MHHPCAASAISVGTRGWISYSFNDNSHCPSVCHLSVCSSMSCCCNSMRRVPLDPSYCYGVYGLRQSSLIQWSSYRKLVFGGFDPCLHSHTRVSAYNNGRSCCCADICCFREKSESGRREKLRKIGVYKERNEREADEVVDEAEVLISLLSDNVDGEYLRVIREARIVGRINTKDEEECSKFVKRRQTRKKRVDVSILDDEIRGEREQEDQALFQQGNDRWVLKKGTHQKEEEEMKFLKEKVQNKRRVLLREENQKDDQKEEEELMKLAKEKRQDLRKDGSSCSSYYSFSSKSDQESDEEIQDRQEKYSRDSTKDHEKNLRSKKTVLEENQEEHKIHEDHKEEYGIDMSKKSSGKEFYAGSSLVESDFRKKSEKKLADVSVEELESNKKTSQLEQNLLEQRTNYGKSSDYYVSYDDRKDKSSTSVRFDEGQQHKQASDTVSVELERRLKYKQLVDAQKIQSIDQSSYGRMILDKKSDTSAKVVNSRQEEVSESKKIIEVNSGEEHNRSSLQVAVVSEIQEMDKQIFESTATNKEENYTTVLSSKNDAKKQRLEFEKVSELIESGKKIQSQSEIQNMTALKQSGQTTKQKEKVNLVYGSTESKELRSKAHTKLIETGQSVIESDEMTKMSTTKLNKEDDGLGGRQPDEQTSVLILEDDRIKSGRKLEKSSTSYVVDYVNQVRHEISSSASKKETKRDDVEILHEDQHQQLQQNIVPDASGDVEHEKHSSTNDDSSSGVEGPSVEMWKVHEPSTTKSDAVVQDDEIKVDNVLAKRSGRSLWKFIGDICRLRWFPESDGHHLGRKREGRSPQSHSVASEAWFSSHEADETEEANKGKGGSTPQVSLQQRQREKTRRQVREGSSSSISEGHLKVEGSHATTESPAITASSSSDGEVSKGNFGASSSVMIVDSSKTSPASRLLRSPGIQGALEVGEGSASDNGSRRQSAGSMVESDSTVNEGKHRRGALQRVDQIQRDKFDEWEEACSFEVEQRKIDEMFMREALLEAQKAADHWEVPVGAVLVHNGKVIARGCNLVEELRDSTAHAEMICIRQASDLLRTWRLSETILYVTLEPCPMCAGAILQARIDTVVWGAPNKLLGADGSWIRLFPNGGTSLDQSDKPAPPVHPFHPKITIRRGVLGSECSDTMQQFFKLRRKKKDVKGDQPSCLPAPHRHFNVLSKMHHAFAATFM